MVKYAWAANQGTRTYCTYQAFRRAGDKHNNTQSIAHRSLEGASRKGVSQEVNQGQPINRVFFLLRNKLQKSAYEQCENESNISLTFGLLSSSDQELKDKIGHVNLCWSEDVREMPELQNKKGVIIANYFDPDLDRVVRKPLEVFVHNPLSVSQLTSKTFEAVRKLQKTIMDSALPALENKAMALQEQLSIPCRFRPQCRAIT